MTAPAKDLLVGRPFGDVYPPRQRPRLPDVGGRTAALRVLRRYVSELTFFKSAGHGRPPTPFRVPEDRFYIERPDPEVTVLYPSIVVLPGDGTYDVPGLTSYPFEASRDIHGKGTVLQVQSEWKEICNLRLTASSRAERRALVAGLEVAMVPTESFYGIRFRMPDYFGEVVCFTLNGAKYEDDDDAQRNRRFATIEMEMRFNVVALVNYVGLYTDIQTRLVGPDEVLIELEAGGPEP